MKQLDFATFIQMLVLVISGFVAVRSLFPDGKIDLFGIIFFWTFGGLVLIYTLIVVVDTKFVQRIKKVDKLEREVLKLKEVLNYKNHGRFKY